MNCARCSDKTEKALSLSLGFGRVVGGSTEDDEEFCWLIPEHHSLEQLPNASASGFLGRMIFCQRERRSWFLQCFSMGEPLSFRDGYLAVARFVASIENPTAATVIRFAHDLLLEANPGEASDPRSKVLAALVGAGGLDVSLDTDAGQPRSARRKTLNTLRCEFKPWLVLYGLATRLRATSAVGVEELTALEPHAANFTRALRPHRVADLSRTDLNRHLDAFVRWLGHADADVVGWARLALDALRPKMPARRRNRFFQRIPTDRLRVCDQEALSAIIGFFRDWDPLIEFAEGLVTQQEQARMIDLRSNLAKQIYNKWPGVYAGSDAEDAVQNAILRLIETATNPHEGYTYDRHFVAWLTKTARYDFHNTFTTSKLQVSLGEFDDPEP